MALPLITMIAAVSHNNVIGKQGTIPWRIPADFKHFKAYTMGKQVVMGRKTWQSIPGNLPGRSVNVITSKPLKPGVKTYGNLKEAINKLLLQKKEIVLAGGQRIYEEGMEFADKLVITHVGLDILGDTYFPNVDLGVFESIHVSVRGLTDEGFFWLTETYERRRKR